MAAGAVGQGGEPVAALRREQDRQRRHSRAGARARRATALIYPPSSSLVMPGLTRASIRIEAFHSRTMDCRVISAFTRVFAALCPAMTADGSVPTAVGMSG